MTEEKWMRISFELDREDNPPLFDELMRFPKGTKRVNRLRTLAHEGLLRQGTWNGDTSRSMGAVRKQESVAAQTTEQSIIAEASHELFGPAIED